VRRRRLPFRAGCELPSGHSFFPDRKGVVTALGLASVVRGRNETRTAYIVFIPFAFAWQ